MWWTFAFSASIFCVAGIFAPVSKISKAVDLTPSSVTSTPRTPRMDLASRLAGKTKKEKEKKEKEKEKEKGKHSSGVICLLKCER